MNDPDHTIDQAIFDEERELLRSIGDEPAYIEQALGLFGGRAGWVNLLLMAAQAILFAGGVWAAWNFFASEDALTALRWGLPAAVALVAALTIKLSLYPVVHVNRIVRELKRLQVQIAARDDL